MRHCQRCGGELREVAVLANYKSFVVSLMRCQGCGATVEHKENAHRPSERGGRRRPCDGNRPTPAESRHTPANLIPDPSRARAEPAPAVRRAKPAKRIERPFNLRVTRW